MKNILHLTTGLNQLANFENVLKENVNNELNNKHIIITPVGKVKDIGLNYQTEVIQIDDLETIPQIVIDFSINIINIYWNGVYCYDNTASGNIIFNKLNYQIHPKQVPTINNHPFGYLCIYSFWQPYIKQMGKQVRNPEKPRITVIKSKKEGLPTFCVLPNIDQIADY